MNKQEKLIVLLLGLALAGWMYHSFTGQKKVAEARREALRGYGEGEAF